MKKLLPALLALFIGTIGARAADAGGFLFVTFRGESSPMTEQVYFMISEDGLNWLALNNAEPLLVSTLGTKGVRDPFIMRSYDNKKFYLLATDLSINRTPDWRKAQMEGSQSIVVWESEDLVHWSEPWLANVGPADAGCIWAPEAAYDSRYQGYLVFWSSRTALDRYAQQRIWAVRTKDFKEFGEPFVYIGRINDIIDATIIQDNGLYYRFSKNESDKTIIMEKSKSLKGGWRRVDNFSLASMKGYEGPTCFMIEPPQGDKPPKWCLLLDHYAAGSGYEAFETDDLASGDFKATDKMNFPFSPVRHGTVMKLTPDEYRRLQAADQNHDFTVETTPDQDSSPEANITQ